MAIRISTASHECYHSPCGHLWWCWHPCYGPPLITWCLIALGIPKNQLPTIDNLHRLWHPYRCPPVSDNGNDMHCDVQPLFVELIFQWPIAAHIVQKFWSANAWQTHLTHAHHDLFMYTLGFSDTDCHPPKKKVKWKAETSSSAEQEVKLLEINLAPGFSLQYYLTVSFYHMAWAEIYITLFYLRIILVMFNVVQQV